LKDKSLLLIVPEFPPNGSIGGRRWAKFAKYLAKEGYVIKVIAFRPEIETKGQNWMADITHPNISVYYLPSGYPKLLKSTSGNILVRVIKKVFTKAVELYDGGIIQDKAIFFKKTMLEKAEELIREFSIRNVICSGPYHRASYFTTLLKKSFSNLNIIIDFRDRWTDGQVYGLEHVSGKAFRKESALQRYTCEHADHVISTYQEIINELMREYPHLPPGKFTLFPHNYDLDDYPEVSVKQRKAGSTEKIRLIYGGTINTAAFNDAFTPFFHALQKMKQTNTALYNLLAVSVYGDNYMLNRLVKELGIEDVVKLSSKIPEKEFYEKVAASDFLLVFLGSKWKDLITTKNITYLPFKRPVLLISEEGEVSRMMSENKLGYCIVPHNCYDNLINLLQNYLNGSLDFDASYDYSSFSFEKATRKLIGLLKN
jgi:glycosyltransferase involved in cell wall biosynthesis